MIAIRISRNHAVHCRAELTMPLPASKVWGQLRDFPTFARQEIFHAEMNIEGGKAKAGANLQMVHRFLFFKAHRVGRICIWKEGVGFAFSDLSLRGPAAGFPHVFSYRLTPVTAESCELEIRVAGKWTATAIPRWVAWLWLRWIMQCVVQSVNNRILLYRLWLRRKKRGEVCLESPGSLKQK